MAAGIIIIYDDIGPFFVIFIYNTIKIKQMKTKIFIVIIGVGLFLISFKLVIDKSVATVDRQQGIYIFMLSKPTANYECLGSVKKKAAWTGQPTEMLNKMIKKIKIDYPKADGVIFNNLNMEIADAILFKEP